MAAIRALCISIALIGFFLIGTPLQWLIARRAPAASHRIPIAFCRSLLWLLKVQVTSEGTHSSDQPMLVVSNHVSWIDILALGSLKPFCFLAKSEVARWPILSAFAFVQGTVFVNRKRRRTIPEVNRQIAARLQEGRSVLLFPEGTTAGGREPGAFLTSHFAATRDLLRENATRDRFDVQPAAIAYSSADAAWVGDDDLVSHLWRTLRAPPVRCAISFGTPIPCLAGSDRKLVAKHARASIAAMLARASITGCELHATTDLDRMTAAGV